MILLGTLQAPDLVVANSWIGNTFGGREDRFVQIEVSGICVAPDGTVYTNTPWDEAGHEVSMYRDGDLVGTAGHTHGWGMMGGAAVAVNGRHVYLAQTVGNEGGGLVGEDTWPPKGLEWAGVSRRLRSDPTKPAPWPGALGRGAGDTLRGHYLRLEEAPKPRPVAGLAANDRTFAVSQGGRLSLYDAETMALRRRLPLPDARLAFAPDGTLWATAPSALRHYAADGRALASIPLPRGVVPSAICADRGRVGVGDDGRDQNVKWFDARTGRLVATLGAKGGVYAGVAGAAGPLRFHSITGLGTDAAGNVFVAHGGGHGGTELEAYSPLGALAWRLLGLSFLDCAQQDPLDDREVFTKERRYRLDYSKQTPGTEAAYAAYTLDRFAFPDDPRLHLSFDATWVRRIGGRRFLFMTNMYSSYLAVYRFDPKARGEAAIPCGFFAKEPMVWPPSAPKAKEWVWIDADGDGRMEAREFASGGPPLDRYLWGWSVDAGGTVRQALNEKGLRTFPFLGLTAQGVPRWSFAKAAVEPMQAPFTNLQRAEYDAATDTMLLSGYTKESPNDGGYWKIVGREIALYEGWSKGVRIPKWRLTPPWRHEGEPKLSAASFCTAGRWLFTVDVFSAVVSVYDLATGAPVGTIRPGPETGATSGWVDIPYGIQAFVRPDGEVVVFVEEDARAKVMMYRWKPSL